MDQLTKIAQNYIVDAKVNEMELEVFQNHLFEMLRTLYADNDAKRISNMASSASIGPEGVIPNEIIAYRALNGVYDNLNGSYKPA